jgi:hypothetical protein
VLNEALAVYWNPNGPSPPPIAADFQGVKVWLELYNTFQQPPPGTPLQPQDGQTVRLQMPDQPNSVPGVDPRPYPAYQVVVARAPGVRAGNDNVLGTWADPATVRVKIPQTPQDTVFNQRASLVQGGQQQGPPNVAHLPTQTYFLLGPPAPTLGREDVFRDPFLAPPRGQVPNDTPLLRLPQMVYAHTRTNGDEVTTTGLTILLRRLANPHIPYNDNPAVAGRPNQPNPWYNPYVTVDFLDRVPVHNSLSAPPGPWPSRGKKQPYAAYTKLQDTDPRALAGDSPTADQTRPPAGNQPQVKHTFGQANDPPRSGKYDWLVHLDRQPISVPELLHVSAYPPHLLTQRFMRSDDPSQTSERFAHYALWFDDLRRLYRLFELLKVRDLARGSPAADGRVTGRINLNTVWDRETFRALCDANASNWISDDGPGGVIDQIYDRMAALRTPRGVPGPTNMDPALLPAGYQQDRPFLSLATGYTRARGAGARPAGQYFEDRGVNDTLLRARDRSGDQTKRRLFQDPRDFDRTPWPHPYQQWELLTKIYNNVTVRSNVFAVWVTVGFFEVTDASATPPTLGAEVGRSEGRHVRHRLFAIVDRSALVNNPGPRAEFNPRADTTLVPYFSIID